MVEPIAGSTGVLVPPKKYLKRLREICDQSGVLLIFDEVITGFGRTGKPFASQSFGVTPDIMTMAKALTNGAQPMGAVAMSRSIYTAIVEESSLPRFSSEFFHGYTWSAHPAACAAAIATLDIYEREGLFERADQMSAYFLEGLFSLKGPEIITDIRGYGMLGAIELEAGVIPGERGHEWQKRMYDNGLHVKASGDCALLAPPFVMSTDHIDQMVDILGKTLRSF